MIKKLLVGLIILAVIIVVLSIWFTGQKPPLESELPPPPTDRVTPGYIRGFDYKLGYGFEYPEDLEMKTPEYESPYEKVEVYTSKEESIRIVVSVKSTNFKSLAEVKGFGYVDLDSILMERFVFINDRNAYEVIFKQYPDIKARWVIFLANDKEYTIECYTTEDLYAASEEIFDHVINSFNIK